MESYIPLKVQSGNSEIYLYYRQHFNDPETADPERSLFVCRLDKKLKSKLVSELFQACGKVDSVQTGKFEKSKAAQGAAPGAFVYFAVLTFQKKAALRNALRPGWLQAKLETSQMHTEPEDPVLQQHIEKMEEGGFQMVMPKKKGDLFEAAVAMRDVEMQSQKKTKKRDVYLKDFYNFQVQQDEDAPNPIKKPKSNARS